MSDKKTKNQSDPLFQLFEHYLLTRSYEDSQAFTKEVANEYLTYLDSTLAHVPLQLRTTVLEDLESETHEMLVKKMYGCAKKVDYDNYGKVMKVAAGKGDKDGKLTSYEFYPPTNKEETEGDKKD